MLSRSRQRCPTNLHEPFTARNIGATEGQGHSAIPGRFQGPPAARLVHALPQEIVSILRETLYFLATFGAICPASAGTCSTTRPPRRGPVEDPLLTGRAVGGSEPLLNFRAKLSG